MRRNRWVVLAAVGALVIGGSVALLATQGLAMPDVSTTTVKRIPSSRAIQESQLWPFRTGSHKAAAAPANAAVAATPPQVETTMYGSWAVTCRDTGGGAPKRTCLASLRATNQRKQLLLSWQIGLNKEGHYVTAVHTPSALAVTKNKRTTGGALLIRNGIELKFGNGPVRVLNYVMCGPRQCVAEGPIDEAFVKDAAANSKATLTVHTTGGAIPFELPINGIDKAIASTRK